MEKITIRRNSMTMRGFRKFSESGITDADAVTVKKMGAMATVMINGERIGNIEEMKYAELPNSYRIRNFVFINDAECKADLEEAESAAETAVPVSNVAPPASAHATASWQQQRIESMEENGVLPSVINAVAATWGDKEVCPRPAVLYRDVNGEVQLALISCLTGNGTLLMGPKSTGKNVLMNTLAYYLNVRYYRMNLDQKSMPEDLYGAKTTDNSAAELLNRNVGLAEAYLEYMNGDETRLHDAARFEIMKAEANSIHLVQMDSSFIKWARNGGLFNADEINLWPTDILVSGLNAVLDGEKTVTIESTGEVINIPEHAYFFGGMNPGYEGTVDLNEAFKSRCNILILDYPESVENQIMANFAGIKLSPVKKREKINAGFSAGHLPQAYIKACDHLFGDFKKMVNSGRVSDSIMNIRGIVRALKMVNAFPDAITLADALNMSIVNGCPDDEQIILRQCIADRIDF